MMQNPQFHYYKWNPIVSFLLKWKFVINPFLFRDSPRNSRWKPTQHFIVQQLSDLRE